MDEAIEGQPAEDPAVVAEERRNFDEALRAASAQVADWATVEMAMGGPFHSKPIATFQTGAVVIQQNTPAATIWDFYAFEAMRGLAGCDYFGGDWSSIPGVAAALADGLLAERQKRVDSIPLPTDDTPAQ